MKIVVLDGFTENPGDLSWEPIEALGELTVYDRTSTVESPLIRERMADADYVISNKTPISAETIDACPNLKGIALLSTGYNVVDYVHAGKKGIPVMNVPAYGTAIVSQFAVALLMEICSHVGHHDRTVKEGRWEKSKDFCYWDFPMIELEGKTAGIIGLGRIGRSTAKILTAMGMRVLAYSPREYKEGREVAQYVDRETLFAEADILLLHCPLFAETEGMICKETIDQMKDGVIIINTSRGALIQEEDLAEALTSGKVYAAAMDVVSTEPIRGDNPLLKAPNCIITPHIAWAAREARQRIMDTTAANLKGAMEGRPVNAVNF